MGEVYRARDTRLGRDVAVKVLPAAFSGDRQRLHRFEQEARAASALNHPNVVAIYDIGQVKDTFYIAMELVEGKTLREVLSADLLGIRKVLAVATQVAEGLARAHAAGIVHRDLKPENVVLSKDNLVKILDFGLAKLSLPETGELSDLSTLGVPATLPGVVMGTVAYMSPEQASGQPVDFRSDQFSFGSILYEMVAGQRPFQGKTAPETLAAIIRDDPRSVALVRPDTPAPLRWIIERCLAKDPEERYASTRDLSRDLAGAQARISEFVSGSASLMAVPNRRGRRWAFIAGGLGLIVLGVLVGETARPLRKSVPASTPSFQRLTFRRGAIVSARFAPDGQTVIYSASWDGEPGRIFLTRPESPESRPFDFGVGQTDLLAVSSSAEMAILVNPVVYGGPGVLARVPLAGGNPRQVLDGVPYASADWSPNGKDLVVVHRIAGKERLEFPVGNTILEGPLIWAPRFSPRGDHIAVYEGGTRGISVVDSTGKTKKVLRLSGVSNPGIPCWRPDGQEIWFSAEEMGRRGALYAIDLAGNRRTLLKLPGQLELLDISREGRLLVVHSMSDERLMGLGPGQDRERELSWLDGSLPADLSPDGATLLFTEAGEGGAEGHSIYLRKMDGSAAVRLGNGDALALSPDGKWVLASVSSGGSSQLVVLPTGPGEVKNLPSTESLVYFGGTWLPDGKRVLFEAENQNRREQLYVQDLEGGKARPIAAEGVWFRGRSPVSPDGKFIIGLQAGNKFALYPIEEGQPRPVAGLEPADEPLGWSADGSSLYVRNRSSNPVKIWVLDPSTGRRRFWLEIKSIDSTTIAAQQLLISRDGKSYVYGASRYTSALYLADGLR
jgi:Tol biopolymer transport system component